MSSQPAARTRRATADVPFEAVYREHRPAMLRVVIGLQSRADAESLVHDVLVDHWLHPERFDAERGSLRTLLLMRVRSRAIDQLRSSTSRQRREEADDSARLRVEVEHDGTREELRDALALLPEDERTPIVHAFYAGRTYAEVATDLGLAEGTVKARIRRGLARLRETLTTEAPGVRSPRATGPPVGTVPTLADARAQASAGPRPSRTARSSERAG